MATERISSACFSAHRVRESCSVMSTSLRYRQPTSSEYWRHSISPSLYPTSITVLTTSRSPINLSAASKSCRLKNRFDVRNDDLGDHPYRRFSFLAVLEFHSGRKWGRSPRQSRHPEQSASQIYHKQRALWRGVEGPRRCLLADAPGSFPAAKLQRKIKSHKL
jgi:hypothetical protein